MRYFRGILIFAVLSYPTSIIGQPTLSVREGLNLATLSGEIMDRGPVNARTTLKMGVSGTFPVRGRFGFQLNGDYVQKGAHDFLYDSSIEVDYIEFSGLVNITLISSYRVPSLSILAGPSVAFKVRSEGEGQLARRHWRDRFEFKTTDFGIIVGLGTQMTFSEAMVIKAELLYTEGIRSINKTAPYDPNFNAETSIKNRGFSVCVGLGFPYGKTGG
jgi:opacity protein-like surface antigen